MIGDAAATPASLAAIPRGLRVLRPRPGPARTDRRQDRCARQSHQAAVPAGLLATVEALYPTLSEGQPGLLGALLARSEAHVVRLAMHYALLDRATEIALPHLIAAVAFWEYADASARCIFGDVLGDPVADEILVALRQAGNSGLTRTQIRDLFGRNQNGARIAQALVTLERGRKAKKVMTQTSGRSAETWFAL